MQLINTIEGLLFRSYLSGYNLSFLHRCIRGNSDDYKNDEHKKAAFADSDFDFERKIDRAKKLAESFIHYCERNSITIISFLDEKFPKQLFQIKDFPPLLFLKGNLAGPKCCAIVGTREPSPLAKLKTEFISMCLADSGYGIISGLALGIDTLAHETAIENKYYTAAILPTAFDRIYPGENIDLSNRILENGGALITEQAPNYHPLANPFVLRNRIIAALSDYIIPVEMGKGSGTKYSLQYAMKYNKKLVLCMHNTFEIDHFLSQYEGIIIAAKKYKAKRNENVILFRNLNSLPELLMKETSPGQSQLFL